MKMLTASNVQAGGVALGGILVNIPLAIIYYYGNLSVYTDSYYISSLGKDNHTPGSLWITTVWSVTFTAGIILSGIISRRIGVRLTLLSGMISFNLGMYTSFFALQSSFWSLHITLGFLTGLGAGLCYSATLLYFAVWFKKRVGFFSAMAPSSFGGGSVIFIIATTIFINPDNLEPAVKVGESKYFSQDEIINRVPYVFLVIGALTTGFHVIAFPLLRNHQDFAIKGTVNTSSSKVACNKSSGVVATHNSCVIALNSYAKNPELYGATESDDLSIVNVDQRDICRSENACIRQNNERTPPIEQTTYSGITPLQALQMKTFYALAVSLGLVIVGLIVMNTYYKQYGVLYISDDYFLAKIGIGMNVTECLLLILWGVMVDKFSPKSVLLSMNSIFAMISVFWYFTPLVDKWFYLTWTLILQASQSGNWVIYPISVLKLFGSDHYMTIYGMIECIGLCIQFATPLLAHVILSELGWFWLFLSVSGSSLLSLMLIICLV